jgi:CheY-like chemotaxis protein
MARILIIEDSPDERLLLTELLSVAGHEVCQASHGSEAMQVLRQKPVEVAITDAAASENGASEVIAALRREYPDVKIIAVSGGATGNPEDSLQLARALGARDVLEKPFTLDEVLHAVKSALKAE